MEGTLATIMMFGGNFAPRNWAFCAGQLIPIASNTALFSLLGTNFGGDGRVTFGLPDLQGRVAIGAGQGPGLTDYQIGEVGGGENTTLTIGEMPAHNHTGTIKIPISTANATTEQANGNILATPAADIYATPDTTPAVNYGGTFTATVGIAGGSQPFPIMQPYECINFVICTAGIFPARN